jgi:hypothetical protein
MKTGCEELLIKGKAAAGDSHGEQLRLVGVSGIAQNASEIGE